VPIIGIEKVSATDRIESEDSHRPFDVLELRIPTLVASRCVRGEQEIADGKVEMNEEGVNTHHDRENVGFGKRRDRFHYCQNMPGNEISQRMEQNPKNRH
jgi:hypothetical protein